MDVSYFLHISIIVFFCCPAHTPDNSFLGFTVSSQLTQNVKKNKKIALLYGKQAYYLEDGHTLVRFEMNENVKICKPAIQVLFKNKKKSG